MHKMIGFLERPAFYMSDHLGHCSNKESRIYVANSRLTLYAHVCTQGVAVLLQSAPVCPDSKEAVKKYLQETAPELLQKQI
jgi:hypothetical protein